MKKTIFTLLFLTNISLFAQEKITKLQYAKTEINVPENCIAKSEYEIIDCNGFSAQWLFLNEEMIKQKVQEQIFSQLEDQFTFKTKKAISFTSQDQLFEGFVYHLKNGNSRILAFGRVNEVPLVLNLGFLKEPTENSDLTEFEKNFIVFKK
ncbi:MAG: hypothetical protein ABI207_04410 [Crocinitomicaceae bacterium]